MYQVFAADHSDPRGIDVQFHSEVVSIEDGVAVLLTLEDDSELRVHPETHEHYVLCRKGLGRFSCGIDYNKLVERSTWREKELLNPSPRIVIHNFGTPIQIW